MNTRKGQRKDSWPQSPKKPRYRPTGHPGTPKASLRSHSSSHTFNRPIKIKKTYYDIVQRVKVQEVHEWVTAYGIPYNEPEI